MTGWGFALLMAAVAAVCLARLSVAARSDKHWIGEVPHVAMGLGMAEMFVPGAPPVPATWGAAGFAVAATLSLGHSEAPGPLRIHGVTGCLAMAYTLAVPAGPVAVNALLAVYFMAEVTWSGMSMAVTADGGAIVLIGPRVGIACHMATGIAMSYMFLSLA